MRSKDLRRRFNIGLGFWIFVVAAIGIFLSVPLDEANFHPVVAAVQHEVKSTLVRLAPYLVVGALGAGVGLAELPLSDLVAFSKRLLKSPEDQQWIEQAAQPTLGLSEQKQRGPIAYYIVNRLGADAVARELEKKS